jgi:hypothetical protein
MNAPNQQRQQAATEQTTEQTPLEKVIEVTQRQQSIAATAASFLGVPPAKVCALLRNIWKPSKGQPELTDSEMFAGLSMIARFGLDPVAKEIYVTRGSKGLMTIIGIDGFVKILNRTEGYDGFEWEMHFSQDGKTLEWVETRIYSTKLSRPICYRAFANEYMRIAGVVAKDLPSHMLRLFSLRHAVRLFTPLGGSVVTEDEARWMDAYQPGEVATNRPSAKQLAQRLAGKQDEPDLTGPQPELPTENGHPGEAEAADAAKEISEQTLPPTLDPAADLPDMRADWLQRLRECTTVDAVNICQRDAMENDGVDILAEAKDKLEAMRVKSGGRKQTRLPGEA